MLRQRCSSRRVVLKLRFSWFLLVWFAVAGECFLYGTESQGTAEPQARLTTRLVVGDVAAPISVPFYLEMSPDTSLKSFTVEVKYPQDTLLFTEVEKYFLLESEEFVLNVEPSPASSENNLRAVEITVSSSVADKAIPRGVIFSIHFSITPEMAEELKRQTEALPETSVETANDTVTLQSIFKQAQTMEGTLVAEDRLAAENEPIVLYQIQPLLSCFFYMH